MDIEWNEWAGLVAGVATLIMVWSMFFNEYVDWSGVPMYLRLTVAVCTPVIAYVLTLRMIE